MNKNLLMLLMFGGGGAGGGGGGSDPFFSDVSLLLHMEGANGSTSIIDSSSNAHTFTTAGGELTTTDPLYGDSSYLTNAQGETTSTPANAAFTLDGAFTIEFSSKMPDGGGSNFSIVMGSHVDSSANNGWFIELGTGRGFYLLADGAVVAGVAASPYDNTKHDWCIERDDSDVIRFYQDGVLLGSGTSSKVLNGQTNRFYIATGVGTYWPNMRSDEIRITKGIARYQGSYTPSIPFPDS